MEPTEFCVNCLKPDHAHRIGGYCYRTDECYRDGCRDVEKLSQKFRPIEHGWEHIMRTGRLDTGFEKENKMYIVTVWYRNRGAGANAPYSCHTTFRGADKNDVARQGHLWVANNLSAYDTQVLLAEVTHVVNPPEVAVNLVPYKEPAA